MTNSQNIEDLLNSSCPQCGSRQAIYDSSFDFWRCEQCEEVWSDGTNDPDYDEDSLEAYEAIVEWAFLQHLEQLAMYGLQLNDQN